jgi:hypothetical protein
MEPSPSGKITPAKSIVYPNLFVILELFCSFATGALLMQET